jgi:hypothetical protein
MVEIGVTTNSIRPLFFLSWAIATVECAAVMKPVSGSVVWFSFAMWVGVFAYGLIRYKKRGLWLLTVAPIVLYIPLVMWLLNRACQQNIKSCL